MEFLGYEAQTPSVSLRGQRQHIVGYFFLPPETWA